MKKLNLTLLLVFVFYLLGLAQPNFQPFFWSEEFEENVSDALFVNNLLYVCTGSFDEGELAIFDITNPNKLDTLFYQHFDTIDFNKILVDGDYLYAGCENGLFIFDISEPSEAVLVNSYEYINTTYFGGIDYLTKYGNILFVTRSWYFYAIDVSNLDNITLLDGKEFNWSNPKGFELLDSSTGILNTSSGIRYVDFSNPNDMQISLTDDPEYIDLIGDIYFAQPSNDKKFLFASSTVWAWNSVDYLFCIDLESNTVADTLITTDSLGGVISMVQVDDDYLIVASSSSLGVINITDKHNMVFLNKLRTGKSPVRLRNGILFSRNSNTNSYDEFVLHYDYKEVNFETTNLEIPHNTLKDGFVARLKNANNEDDVLSYTLVSGDGDSDNLKFYISEGRLYANQYFNLEEQTEFSVRIKASDNLDNTKEKVFRLELKKSNWLRCYSGMSGNVREIYQVNDHTIWAIDDEQNIAYSSNCGVDWESVVFNVNGNGPDNMFANRESTAYALVSPNYLTDNTEVGVYKTVNNMQDWVQLDIPFCEQSFPDVVYFWDEDEGIVIGDPINDTMEVYKTYDAGASWIKLNNDIFNKKPGVFNTNHTHFVIDDCMWQMLISGELMFSNNRGENWDIISNGHDVYSFPVFINKQEGVLYSWINNTIQSTTDGGKVWSDKWQPECTIFHINVIPGTNKLASVVKYFDAKYNKYRYTIAYSSDLGISWQYDEGNIYMNTFTNISFLNEDLGWIGSTSGRMFRYIGKNQAPEIVNPIGNIEVEVGDELAFIIPDNVFLDNESEVQQVVFMEDSIPLPDWLIFNSEINSFTGTPSENDLGKTEICLVGIDECNVNTISRFTIEVVEKMVSSKSYSENLLIRPNPVTDILNISSVNPITEIKLYDISGKQVYYRSEIDDEKFQLDIARLECGVYLVKIEFDVNGSVIKKISKY